ncbi:hypothetical protein B0H10DRAFT_2043970 [Mycena sp. CBHHK59/15]|nr:hypothetical protein B0H10DRAFT_2043970 [Mycena sp. CBHHK59/15]
MSDSELSLSATDVQIQLNVNYYFSITAFTILFYDYLLTIDQEVSWYWGTQMTWATLLFYLNRYGSLVGSIPIVVEYFWTSGNANKIQICHNLQTYHQYYAIVAQVFVSAILIIRTYALYERSWRLLTIMVFVALVIAGIAGWTVFTGKGNSDALNERFLPVGCIGYAWIGMLVFDIMIFVLTVYKAVVFSWERRGGLLFLLMRDGNIASFMVCGIQLFITLN